MASASPTLPKRDTPVPKTKQPRHAFPTAPHAPRAQPPPFRRRTSTFSSITSTSTTGSTTSLPSYTAASTPGPARPLSPDETSPPGAIVWLNGFPGVGKLTIAQWLHRLLGTDRSIILNHQSQLAHANGVAGSGGAPLLPPTPEVEITDPFFSMPGGSGAGGSRGRRGTGSSLHEVVNRPENARKIVIVTSCVLSPGLKDEKEKAEAEDTGEKGETVDEGDKGDEERTRSEEAAVSAAKQCLADTLASNRPFIPVYLTCQEEENMRRVQSLERRYSFSSSVPSSPTTQARSRLSYSSPPTSRDKANRASLARTLREGRDLFLFEGVNGLDLDVTDLEAHQAAMDILGFVNTEVELWQATHAP